MLIVAKEPTTLQALPADLMINVYRRGELLLVCHARDWRLFVPGLKDEEFVWAQRLCAPLCKWTWDWL